MDTNIRKETNLLIMLIEKNQLIERMGQEIIDLREQLVNLEEEGKNNDGGKQA
jgi:hypothetical protein